jgi:hypothetical protein
MLSYAFVDGFTPASREEAIGRTKSAIAEAGGVIVDFAFFSGAIRLSVEMEAGAMPLLLGALEEGAVHVFDERLRRPIESRGRVVAMLHVTFGAEVEVAA